MNRLVLGVLIIFAGPLCHAQYFQYSQFNFAPQRINPAQIANSNFASISLISRDQATAGDFHLNSNIINVAYPLISGRSGRPWSGIGLSVMDDRAGQAGIFNTQEAALSYAINVSLSKFQIFSLGVKGLYQTQRIDLNGLTTGSQYIPDRGFLGPSDENLGNYKRSIATVSAGLYWQESDKKGNKAAYLGVSFFDFNKPSDSFLGSSSQYNTTIVASGGIRTYQQNNISVFPEILYTRSASNNVLNLGFITSYEVKPPNKPVLRFDLLTKYVIGRSGILGIQLHRENFSVGFSYDFPVIKQNAANTHAFELGLELRRLVEPMKKNKVQAKKKTVPTNNRIAKSNSPKDTTRVVEKDTLGVRKAVIAKQKMSERLRQKQDSVKAQANAGQIKHEPLILEKATLHFNFSFGSFDIGDDETKYLKELVTAFIDNPDLKIKLTGHTDNVGSDKFNMKLSVQRAEMIRDFLVSNGLDPARIQVEGKGLREPMTTNTTEEGRSKNRRVALEILYNN